MSSQSDSSLDLNAPNFSQGELCQVAGISNATANNWIHGGFLKPANIRSRGSRKPRLFSVITIFHAKVTGRLVDAFRIQPSTAASIAQTTTKHQSWMALVTHEKNPNSYWSNQFATVSRSESDSNWDISFNSPEDSKIVIAIKFGPARKEIAQMQTGPFLVIGVLEDFASVYRQCEAILSESPNENISPA